MDVAHPKNAKIMLQGSFGSVVVKDGKAIKRPIEDNDVSMNRELIAYQRMKGSDVCVPRLIEYIICNDSKSLLGYVRELTFEDAGQSLRAWMKSGWLFDPVHVLLHPLLKALRFLKDIGIVHGDIHPGNVCLRCGRNGDLNASLIDFGRSVVVKDGDEWLCLPDGTLIDPRTKLPCDQSFAPSTHAVELELANLYNLHLHRDPLALIASAVTHEGTIPRGLTLGNVDDVYGLGMCIVRVLTMMVHYPWNDWLILNGLARHGGNAADIDKRKNVVADILRYNPAWDPRFFCDLHLRFRPVSSNPEDAQKMEASARAIGIHLLGVYPLYPRFFGHLAEVYDDGTSDLVRGCVHPDRHRRYAHAFGELPDTLYTRRKTNRPKRYVRIGPRDVRVKTNEHKGIIHVSLVRCWIMTGIVQAGRVKWWKVAAGVTRSFRKKHNTMNVMRHALSMFITKARELDPSLCRRPCTTWPFEFESQRRAWLNILELHRSYVAEPLSL